MNCFIICGFSNALSVACISTLTIKRVNLHLVLNVVLFSKLRQDSLNVAVPVLIKSIFVHYILFEPVHVISNNVVF